MQRVAVAELEPAERRLGQTGDHKPPAAVDERSDQERFFRIRRNASRRAAPLPACCGNFPALSKWCLRIHAGPNFDAKYPR
jgi:hypothetical protein